MATTTSGKPEADDETIPWQVRGRTTIELRQRGAGEWLATQRGVDTRRGPSAAATVAASCRAIDAVDGGIDEGNDPER